MGRKHRNAGSRRVVSAAPPDVRARQRLLPETGRAVSASSTHPGPNDARAWSATAAAIGVAAGLLLLWIPLGHPRIGAFSDSIEYIILAQQLRALSGGGEDTLFMHTRLPAGFSAWLALAGVDVAHAARAHWMNWLAFAWAIVAWALWIAREVPHRAGTALAALTLALPGFLIIALNPVSESLFAALIGMMLLGAVRRPAPGPTLRAAAMIAAALLPLVRTAGLPLTFAYAAWEWGSSPAPRGIRGVLRAIAVVLPGALWHGWRATLPIQNSYSTSFDLGQLRDRFGSLADFLRIQTLAIPDALARLIDPVPDALAFLLATIVLVLAAIGWWRRWGERALDAWLLPPALGILQIWPWPNEYPRMLWPVLPMLAVCAWQGITLARHRFPAASRIAVPTFAMALVLCLLSAWMSIALRISLPVPLADRPFQRQAAYLLAETPQEAARVAAAASALDRAIRSLPTLMPPDDCVYAIAAEAVWLNSGGRVLARHFDPRIDPSAPLPPQLRACRFVFAARLTSPQFPQLQPLFPLQAAEPWAEVTMRADFAAGPRRQTAAALLRQRHWPASTAPGVTADRSSP